MTVRWLGAEGACFWSKVEGLSNLCVGEPWPELLGSLFQASQSPDVGQREGAFKIFAATPGIIEKQHEETVQSAFARGFKDEDVSVGFVSLIGVDGEC